MSAVNPSFREQLIEALERLGNSSVATYEGAFHFLKAHIAGAPGTGDYDRQLAAAFNEAVDGIQKRATARPREQSAR